MDKLRPYGWLYKMHLIVDGIDWIRTNKTKPNFGLADSISLTTLKNNRVRCIICYKNLKYTIEQCL